MNASTMTRLRSCVFNDGFLILWVGVRYGIGIPLLASSSSNSADLKDSFKRA